MAKPLEAPGALVEIRENLKDFSLVPEREVWVARDGQLLNRAAAQKAREVAERNAEAEQTRFDVGMSTNYNVVQAQNNLTTQRLAELRALISYLNAVAEFDRIQRVGR